MFKKLKTPKNVMRQIIAHNGYIVKICYNKHHFKCAADFGSVYHRRQNQKTERFFSNDIFKMLIKKKYIHLTETHVNSNKEHSLIFESTLKGKAYVFPNLYQERYNVSQTL